MATKSAVQVILSCEHGGNQIPDEYQKLFKGHTELLQTHQGVDIGALTVAKLLEEHLHAPLTYCEVSRLLIDTNRYLQGRVPFSKISQTLNTLEQQRVIDLYYQPHWDRIIKQIRQSVSSGNQNVLHLAIHSMTDKLNGQVRSMNMALLFDPSRSFETELVNLWQEYLQQRFPDFEIAQNEPYRGDDEGMTTYLRTEFADPVYAGIELELNQGMLQNMSSNEVRELSHGLAESLDAALSEIAKA